MKKVFLIILVILLSGCSKSDSPELVLYKEYLKEVKNTESTNTDLPFNIEITIDKIVETEVMYRVIIDKPKIPLRNIEVIAIHDKNTKDIFPSSGIFDDKLNLIPNVINKSSNYVEGIILVGYIPFEDDIKNLNANFKILFKYVDDDEKNHTIVYSTKK